MTYPTPYTVSHEAFNGTDDDDDALGNDLETWSPGVDVNVIGWYTTQVETLAGHTSRVIADVDLLVPPDLDVSVRDRFRLPGDENPFEVADVEDYNHGFHQWQPGSVVKLRRVTG